MKNFCGISDTLLINSGRSRATMGVGNHGKLLLVHELPPLDVFRTSVKFGKNFKFKKLGCGQT